MLESDLKELPRRNALARALFNAGGELRAGWRLSAFLLITTALSVLLLAMVHLLNAPLLPPSPAGIFSGEITIFVAVLLATLIMSRAERRPLALYGVALRGRSVVHFAVGGLFGFVSFSALISLLSLHHNFTVAGRAIYGSELRHFALLWAGAFLAVALFEEFLFRGYALFTLATGLRFWPAATALGVAFGAIHLGNIGENWIGGAGAALIGLFFCFTVRRTGDLWWAVGFHALWDYAETFIYSAPDSGMVASGHLLNSRFQGSALWTGGSVGPEASVLVFVIIAALFAIVHFLYPQTRYPQPLPSRVRILSP